MRNFIRDWRDEWIATNGQTDELEVVIKDHTLDLMESYIYEGSFAGIPDEILDKRVIETARIVASSVQERTGAYSLMV